MIKKILKKHMKTFTLLLKKQNYSKNIYLKSFYKKNKHKKYKSFYFKINKKNHFILHTF